MKQVFFIIILQLLSCLRFFSRFFIKDIDKIWLQDFGKNIPVKNRLSYIIDYCKGKRVLHFGFADMPFTAEKIKAGTMLHLKIKEVATEVVGLDFSADACKLYEQLTGDSNYKVLDIFESEKMADQLTGYDVIVLGEIVEHLPNPGEALTKVKSLMGPNTHLIVTVPNAYSLNYLFGALNQLDNIHPDHLGQFSPYTLHSLVKYCGFSVVQFCFGLYRAAGEKPGSHWQNFPWLADGLIIVLKKNA